jgi:hypothetical protein
MQNLKLERELISHFFLKDRKERYIGFVSNPTKRHKWIKDLRDDRCLDPRYYREIAGKELSYNKLVEIYHQYGVREVYMASYHEELDGITISIETALKEMFEGNVLCMETYAYCSKEKTGFFFNHEGWFYLLSKKL